MDRKESAPRTCPGAWRGREHLGGEKAAKVAAISIPDPIFESAERLAERMRKSRSQVYSEAVAEYVARHDPHTATERINAVCDDVDTRADPFLTEAAQRVLAANSW